MFALLAEPQNPGVNHHPFCSSCPNHRGEASTARPEGQSCRDVPGSPCQKHRCRNCTAANKPIFWLITRERFNLYF